MVYAAPPLEVLAGVWDLVACNLSIKDWCNLSQIARGWQEVAQITWRNSRWMQIVQAMEATIPELNAVLVDRQLTVAECNTPSKQTRHLWTTTAFLMSSPAASRWGPILAAIPGLGVDLQLTELFEVPQLPQGITQHLVQQAPMQPSGSIVRIYHSQLIAAAYNRVAVIETWVQVQHQLGIVTDIPDIAERICRGDVTKEQLDDWEPQAHEEAVDMLQLAINGSSGATAALVAARLLYQLSDEAEIRDLLQTAVMRAHHEVLRRAVRRLTSQNMSESSVLRLMQTAAEVCPQPLWQPPAAPGGHNHMPHPWQIMMEEFPDEAEPFYGANFPVAAEPLFAADFPFEAELMFADLLALNPPPVPDQPPQHIPAAPVWPQLHPHNVLDILDVDPDDREHPEGCSIMHWLVKLPTARKVALEALLQVARTVVVNGCGASVRALCRLLRQKQVDMANCSSLLEVAVTHNQRAALVALCGLPAAGQVHLAVWLKALEALRTSNIAAAAAAKMALLITVACNLRQQEQAAAAAAHFDPPPACSRAIATALDILGAAKPLGAAEGGNEQVAQARLRQLSDQAHRLLRMSKEQQQHALSHLVRQCSDPLVNPLHLLRTATEVSQDILYHVMSSSVQHHNFALLTGFCELPMSADLQSEAVHRLLADLAASKAASSVDEKMQQQLCKLPGATQISDVQLSQVMSALVARRAVLTVELCQLPAAKELTGTFVADQLQLAVQQQDRKNVNMICLQLQQCQTVTSELLTQLICTTVSDHQYAICSTLCEFANTASIQVCNVDVLLGKALEVGNGDLVRTLCQLPSADSMKPAILIEQLLDAIKINSAVAVYSLCQLPAVVESQFDNPAVSPQLLQTAVQLQRSNVIACLGQLAAVRRLPAEAFAELLHTAEQQGDQQMVRAVKRVAAMAKDGFNQ